MTGAPLREVLPYGTSGAIVPSILPISRTAESGSKSPMSLQSAGCFPSQYIISAPESESRIASVIAGLIGTFM